MQMPLNEHLQEKWAPLLDYEGMDPIKDAHRRAVTAQLLENQEVALKEEREFLYESPTNAVGNGGYTSSGGQTVAGFDPVLISLIRRSMPNLVAYDLAGVQPMSGPTGLIFAMRSKYKTQGGSEALFDEADSAFSGQDSNFNRVNGFTAGAVGMGTTGQTGSNPAALNPTSGIVGDTYSVGQGLRTDDAENLGDGIGAFNEMAFSIEKVTVTAKSRALKAEYSLELAQDLKAIHGLNAEAELANILSTEILAEINREVIRTIYRVAEQGAATNVATQGAFDLDVDSNGRWSVEKFKGLIFQIERDANAIAQRTRRGKGNMILCSADVASALTTSTLTTPVTPSLVFLLVSSASTLTHIRLTSLPTSTTLLVIRVLPLTTLVYSTAHTFLSKWFVPLVRTPSSPRLDSRPATAWSPTHSLRALLLVLALLPRTSTATTEESRFKTSCDLDSHICQGVRKDPFFYLNTNKTDNDCFTV
jgi:hypothetical protein